MQIADVEGIGPAHASRLAVANIHTDADLLAAGATRDGRAGLATSTGIREPILRTWVNHIDLALLEGAGPATRACSRPPASIAALSWLVGTPSTSRPP